MEHLDPATLRRALEHAHTFFRSPRILDPSWVGNYLNRRNLYGQLRFAGIGYAPAGWTVLVDHLRRGGYTDPIIEAAGLGRRASTGQLIDHFRDRLVIPMTDANRRLVGFVGRAAERSGPDVPKYLNSPSTQLYDKSRVLYALGEDRSLLQHGAMPVLVEGALDRLALRQAAHHLAVVGLAPSGTALTAGQVDQLVDVVGTRRPIAVALDADQAGREATLRAWTHLTAAGARNLLHIALPEGRDPADLVRAGHDRQLRHAIVASRPLSVVVADHKIAAAGPIDHLHGHVGVLRQVLAEDLAFVPIDKMNVYLGHLARRLGLDHAAVTAAAADQLAPDPPVPEALDAHALAWDAYPLHQLSTSTSTPSPVGPSAAPLLANERDARGH